MWPAAQPLKLNRSGWSALPIVKGLLKTSPCLQKQIVRLWRPESISKMGLIAGAGAWGLLYLPSPGKEQALRG